VIIEVAETHPPKTGKKLGTVKTATGESFGIWPDKLSALRVGGRYDIEFDENEFNGHTYRKITKVQAVEAIPPAPRAAHCAVEVDDVEQQFVCSLLNAAIAAGTLQIQTDALVAAIKTTRAAWAQTFGAS
jgi:hypothetical protein